MALLGYSYTKNRENKNGSVSWICQRRCGGWAMENFNKLRTMEINVNHKQLETKSLYFPSLHLLRMVLSDFFW